MITFKEQRRLRAMCLSEEAIRWFSGNAESLEEGWARCPRGEWLLRIAGSCSGPAMSPLRRAITGVLVEMAKSDPAPRSWVNDALMAASRFACGEIGDESLMQVAARRATVGFRLSQAEQGHCTDSQIFAHQAVLAATACGAWIAGLDGLRATECLGADLVRQFVPTCPDIDVGVSYWLTAC